jgi:hypothetical protein
VFIAYSTRQKRRRRGSTGWVHFLACAGHITLSKVQTVNLAETGIYFSMPSVLFCTQQSFFGELPRCYTRQRFFAEAFFVEYALLSVIVGKVFTLYFEVFAEYFLYTAKFMFPVVPVAQSFARRCMPAVTVGLLRVHFSYSLLIFVHDWFDFFFLSA